MALCAAVALAASILFRDSLDHRMLVCIIVSVAAATIGIGAALTGKFMWALLFVSVLGLFTPFHPAQLSYVHNSILDMAAMALFAASPMMFGKSAGPLALKHPAGKL
jgi:hypothetical protein